MTRVFFFCLSAIALSGIDGGFITNFDYDIIFPSVARGRHSVVAAVVSLQVV